MSRKIRNRTILVFLLLMCLGVAGCGKKEKPSVSPSPKTQQTSSPESDAKKDTKKKPEASKAGEKEDAEKKEDAAEDSDKDTKKLADDEIEIYTINNDTLDSTPTKIQVEEKQEVTPELIVEAVVKDFSSHSLEIGIDSITTSGETVTVSFQYGAAPLSGVGSDVEETILNCISDSLLDNVKGCKAVVFQAEGGPYQSGHLEFGVDEIYASK